MADLGMIPSIFGARSSRFNIPWVGILFSTAVCIGASYMNFEDIISSANLLYSLGMLLEFASFPWLRRKMPHIKRLFVVLLRLLGLVVMFLVPMVFRMVIVFDATKVVYLVTGPMTVGENGFYFPMKLCRSKKMFTFSDVEDGGAVE